MYLSVIRVSVLQFLYSLKCVGYGGHVFFLTFVCFPHARACHLVAGRCLFQQKARNANVYSLSRLDSDLVAEGKAIRVHRLPITPISCGCHRSGPVRGTICLAVFLRSFAFFPRQPARQTDQPIQLNPRATQPVCCRLTVILRRTLVLRRTLP